MRGGSEEGESNLNYNIIYCSYLLTSLFYCLETHQDAGSALWLGLTLVTITKVVPDTSYPTFLKMIAAVTFLDAVLKGLISCGVAGEVQWVGQEMVGNIIHLKFGNFTFMTFVYLVALSLSWVLPLTYQVNSNSSNKRSQEQVFIRFLSHNLEYITPLLLYCLCFFKNSPNQGNESPKEFPDSLGLLFQFQHIEKTLWCLVTYLFLLFSLDNLLAKKVVAILSIALIVRDHSHLSYFPIYSLSSQVITGVKVALIIFFRIHNQACQFSPSSMRDSIESGMTSIHYRNFSLRRKMTLTALRNQRNISIVLLLNALTTVLTNGPGNGLIILAIFLNLPHYRSALFHQISAIGMLFSALLQPHQFLYFGCLMVTRHFYTQDEMFELRHWSLVRTLARGVVLFTKVSLLNLLIGLFQSSWLIMITLVFRNICSCLGYILVFMGTEDQYGYYIDPLVPSSFFTDVLLWCYLVLLKMYTPRPSQVFVNTDITNIFEQYPVINYFQSALKVLKIFHWIGYAVISLMVLSSPPSLLTLIRVILLVLTFVAGILESHRSTYSANLWTSIFYTQVVIVFIKYFYLLSQYDNLSPWLLTFLDPLEKHSNFIGLEDPDSANLWGTFGRDFIVLFINSMILFIIRIQLSQIDYQRQRDRIVSEQHLSRALLDEPQEKSIHYLYTNYIKTEKFRFKSHSSLTSFLTDFLLDVCFWCYLGLYYLFYDHHFNLTLPFFLLFGVAFALQDSKNNHKYTFAVLVGLSSLDIIWLYASYIIALLEGVDPKYELGVLVSKYLLLILSVIFNVTDRALIRFYQEYKVTTKVEHEYLLFKMLTPIIPNQRHKRQVALIYLLLFKVASLAFFFALLVAGPDSVQWLHLFGLVAIAVMFVIPKLDRRRVWRRYWSNIMLGVVLIDIWMGFGYALFACVCLRCYFMMLEQFHKQMFVEKYGHSNKTINDQSRRRVEKIEAHFGNKLEPIDEVGQRREGESYVTFQGSQVPWKEYNTYTTIIWLLPYWFQLVTLLGVMFLEGGIVTLVLFATQLAYLIVSLRKIQSVSIDLPSMKIIWGVSATLVFATIIYIGLLRAQHELTDATNQVFGVFFCLCGLGFYIEFSRGSQDQKQHPNYDSTVIEFGILRSQQALEYWKEKSKIVGVVASQIHNQKKLISLKTHFLMKEKLTLRVDKLMRQLAFGKPKRKSSLQLSDGLLVDKEDEMSQLETSFQISSNMLTFMSVPDLEYCFVNLNLYYQGEVGTQVDVVAEAASARVWILRNYDNSIRQTILEYSLCHQMLREPLDQDLPQIREEGEEQDRVEEDRLRKSDIPRINSAGILDKPKKQISVGAMPKEKFSPGVAIERRDYCGNRISLRLKQLPWWVSKLVQNLEIVGMVVAAGWNFFGGVYTVPVNIAIFAWAVVLQTKTTVLFWIFLMGYTSLVVAAKMVLDYLPAHSVLSFVFYYHSGDYFYQFLIISVCTVQIIVLQLGGILESSYTQTQNIYDAFYRTVLNEAVRGAPKPGQKQFLRHYETLSGQQQHSFIQRVFSKTKIKPGKDFYPTLAVIQVIILLYIFFFYDLMQFESQNNRKSIGEILLVTKFSTNMIVVLLLHVLVMVSDRLIVSLNIVDQSTQKLQNFFFRHVFGGRENDEQWDGHCRGLDVLLLVKYVFHVWLVLAINFMVYFYIPSAGLRKSLIPQCQKAVCGKSYTYLSIFLLLYLVYFLVSGLQIKHGFNRDKCRNTLMQKFGWVDYCTYMFFAGLPFLWEFKKISDWTTTATALPLFYWMKFQDINARVYQSKCQAQLLSQKPLGRRVWYKYLLGPPAFMFILCLIFAPIVMYSSFNPFAVRDSVVTASFELDLQVGRHSQYRFFETSHARIEEQGTNQQTQKLLGFFDRANLFNVQSSRYPDRDFLISQPAVERLASRIQDTYSKKSPHDYHFKLSVMVTEREGGESTIEWARKPLSYEQLQELHDLLVGNKTSIELSSFYSALPGTLQNQSIVLSTTNQGQYYEVTTAQDAEQQSPGVAIYYKSSVKYKIAFGLLTFYLTYVVLINSLFRFYLTGNLEDIPFQGPHVDKILYLCDAIRSARILENFFQEEYLYFSLVDLMRSPNTLKEVAGDFQTLREPSHGHQKRQ